MRLIIIACVLTLMVAISIGYSSCPPLQFNPPAKIIDSKIYIAKGTTVVAPDCEDWIHTCSNTARSSVKYPHYITITGNPNVDFFILNVKEENVSVGRKDVVNAIKDHTYDSISFENVKPFDIQLQDVPSLDDVQGVPPYTLNCEDYTTTTSLTFTFVPQLEIKVHNAVKNFVKRLNNTQTVKSKKWATDDLSINETIITTTTTYLDIPSTAYEKVNLTTNITNVTRVTNITTNEILSEEIFTKITSDEFYVNYEGIFQKFYDEAKIKSRAYSEICGVTSDILVKGVTSYTFTKGGTYYVYGSGIKVVVE